LKKAYTYTKSITLANIEPAVLAVYDMPVGTDLEFCFDNTGRYFIDTNTGKRI